MHKEAQDGVMENDRRERIIKIYNWTRFILFIIFIVLLCVGIFLSS